MKHLLKMLDLSGEEILEILDLADQLNNRRKHSVGQLSLIYSIAAPEHTKQPAQLKCQVNPHTESG